MSLQHRRDILLGNSNLDYINYTPNFRSCFSNAISMLSCLLAYLRQILLFLQLERQETVFTHLLSDLVVQNPGNCCLSRIQAKGSTGVCPLWQLHTCKLKPFFELIPICFLRAISTVIHARLSVQHFFFYRSTFSKTSMKAYAEARPLIFEMPSLAITSISHPIDPMTASVHTLSV